MPVRQQVLERGRSGGIGTVASTRTCLRRYTVSEIESRRMRVVRRARAHAPWRHPCRPRPRRCRNAVVTQLVQSGGSWRGSPGSSPSGWVQRFRAVPGCRLWRETLPPTTREWYNSKRRFGTTPKRMSLHRSQGGPECQLRLQAIDFPLSLDRHGRGQRPFSVAARREGVGA